MFHGETHYVDWAIFNSYVKLPEDKTYCKSMYSRIVRLNRSLYFPFEELYQSTCLTAGYSKHGRLNTKPWSPLNIFETSLAPKVEDQTLAKDVYMCMMYTQGLLENTSRIRNYFPLLIRRTYFKVPCDPPHVHIST